MQTEQQKAPTIVSILIAYLLVYFVWGSTYFFIENIVHTFKPFVLGSIRFIIAGSILFTYCRFKGYKLYSKTAVREALFIGFLLLFVDMAAIIWAEQHISSAIVSILAASTAIWFIICDKPKWKENFSSPPTILGLLFGFAGVFLLFAEQLFSENDTHATGQDMKLVAMIVLVLGSIGWTIGSLVSKYRKEKRDLNRTEEKEEDLNVMVKTAWQMLSAGASFTIVALLNGEYAAFDPSAIELNQWGSMMYLVTMGSILAFGSYLFLLQHRPATEVSTYAYVNPIVAVILAYFFTDHEVTILQMLGLVIVLVSVVLMNWDLYSNNKKFKAYKRAKRIKKIREMAAKSSIPRIIEISNFNEDVEKKKVKSKDSNKFPKRD